MRRVCRVYKWFCERWGPDGMTFSSWAWRHAMRTGDTFYRDRIDGLFLLVAGKRNHCQASYQRETKGPK